ncbi:hypothetical protein M3D02_002875 [Micrococcus luteus]|uniref:hypothetical protein n=1 Tax=Micrococcus sp. KRD153 TaxID=2729724 RepID=UPI0019D14F52|nr:hypothetical protein [Micrococcus sp. KRD153]MCV7455664.1 hypothetical protein [Micrococcus luteus]MCV7555585.1 hypothetical protein [Micrococcus luteus]MDN5692188.1 hypothetical protein [Micrococcaceae bacterium]
MKLDLLYVRPGGSGWGPVTELVQLTARLFDARIIEVDDVGEVSPLRKAASFLPRLARPTGRHLLVIASNPAVVAYMTHPRLWFPGYETTAVWIIDSFWTDRTPSIMRGRPHIDHLFITDPGLEGEWHAQTNLPVDVLAWGADTSKFALSWEPRPTDLLRLGRQPDAWDDDEVTRTGAARHGLRFEGRPSMSHDPLVNQQNVREALLRSKMVLAFSNLVSPASYTHPTREYLTGRWMDALGAGCLVAGAAPAAARETLWNGSTLEISPVRRSEAWPVLVQAADSWNALDAVTRQLQARDRLDWRLRLLDACVMMGWPPPTLLTEQLDQTAI